MAKWPYNTPEWRDLRARKLEAAPWCEVCIKRGKRVRGVVVDHIQAISKGGDPFPPLSGLMSMCWPCHNTKTSAIDRPGGSGVAIKGCGPDGFPLDPSHPAYGAKGDTPSTDGRVGPLDRCGARLRTKFPRGRRWD